MKNSRSTNNREFFIQLNPLTKRLFYDPNHAFNNWVVKLNIIYIFITIIIKSSNNGFKKYSNLAANYKKNKYMKKFTLQLFAAAFALLISNTALLAQFTVTSTTASGCAPVSVTFTVTNPSTSDYYYVWQFGDGTTVNDTLMLPSKTHSFTIAGNYYYSSSSISLNAFD